MTTRAFNVADLFEYYVPEKSVYPKINLRASSFQVERIYVGQILKQKN